MNLRTFENAPLLDLRLAEPRSALTEALAALDNRLPLDVPALIGDEAINGRDLVSTDPGAPDRVIATAPRAGRDLAERAIGVAVDGFERWSATPQEQRSRILIAAAGSIRSRRHEIAALEVREAAKPWPEADADVAEAIDYLEYYARRALDLARGPQLIQVPGERNAMRYFARGVTAAITPWNFPLAIPCGITSAALATGNTVILKPAEQAPAVAFALVEALRSAGVPSKAIQFLPGEAEAGRALVEHPAVATIGFTGSEAAGLEIIQSAGTTADGQLEVKRAVCEMGGKNAIVVDTDADLDEAVPAILRSAFAYAGQKCSAAARILCAEPIAEQLEKRLRGAVEVLLVGQASDFATDVPPLIERAAQERVLDFVTTAGSEGRIVAKLGAPATGWFVGPTVVADLPAGSRVITEEVFGPLLCLETVGSIDDALEDLNSRRHALTCGIFSRSPSVVDHFCARAPAGNIYVNRQITGAVVGRQPFGGNRYSGVGDKAGGPDYLLRFVNSRVIAENTMRHGLVTKG